MVLVLIFLLFTGLVAFGHMSLSHTYTPPVHGYVNGTIFYSDGETPLVLNDATNGDFVYLTGPNNFNEQMETDANGYFSSLNVAPGDYRLAIYRSNSYIGGIDPVIVIGGQTVTENVTTSRMPANLIYSG